MTRASADRDLLDRWNDGDQRAGTELLQRHSTALHQFLRNRARHDLEDIVQQTARVHRATHGLAR